MEVGLGFVFFILIGSAIVGLLLGLTVDKGSAGILLGLFLGPIGWIIVFLLPRNQKLESKADPSNKSIHQSSLNKPTPDLESDSYKIWLGNKYQITKNELFEKYECKEQLFTTLDDALSFAHEQELTEEYAKETKPDEDNEQRMVTVVGTVVIISIFAVLTLYNSFL